MKVAAGGLAQVRTAARALGRAMSRPRIYPAVREAISTGLHVALYPAGLLQAMAPLQASSSIEGLPADSLALRSLAPESASTPIVMIHGYLHNPSGFIMMGRALTRRGFLYVSTMSYNPLGRGVPDLAEDLARTVDVVRRRTGADRVHLIGHSLGGLIARWYVQELGGEAAVDTCVTLGAPHQGTFAALAGPTRLARQLRPGSELIRRLDRGARPTPVRYVAYYSNLDALIIPSRSARLDHPALAARNVLVADHGHLSLLMSRTLIRSVIHTLVRSHDSAPAVGRVVPERRSA